MTGPCPAGVLVYDGPPRTKEWFAARRAGITASEVPGIVGASDYSSALHVWLDKRGELPDQGHSHYAEAGIRAEPMIAQWWSDDHAVKVTETGVWASAEHPWRRCSPDRLIDRCPDGDGPCGLEVKNKNAYVAGQWSSDDVPDDVLAQVAWTMTVTGWRHVHVAALIGGNTPRWHRVDHDQALEDYLIGEAARVWDAVQAGVRPLVDPSAALSRLLEALHPDEPGGQIIDPGQAVTLWQLYEQGAALERQGKALKDDAKHAAIAALDGMSELWVPGRARPLFTWLPQPRTGIVAEQLARLAREHPKIHARLVREQFVTTTSSRVGRWNQRTGKEISHGGE